MEQKQLKFLKMFNAFSRQDISKPEIVAKFINDFIKLDYTYAEDVWEYLLIEAEANLSKSEAAEVFVDLPLGIFCSTNPARIAKTLSERLVIRRGVFFASPTADKGNAFSLMLTFLLGNKYNDVEESLKLIMKNTAMESTYGEYMKALIEKYFIELMKKSPEHKIVLNRKMAPLLNEYCSKIKTEEKPLLLQRIKEVL